MMSDEVDEVVDMCGTNTVLFPNFSDKIDPSVGTYVYKHKISYKRTPGAQT